MTSPAQRYWVGVASREHVLAGVRAGFAQVCHGKAGPLARMRPGDGIVYYSPRERFDSDVPCRAFTALGHVVGEAPYRFDMGGGFVPYRRDVEYVPARDVPIGKLRGSLSFLSGSSSWGYVFRRGCFEIPARDFLLIARAMGAAAPARSSGLLPPSV
ncbi:EVE domain-containing protein [Sorangium sp. So ce119]|uniref:EVE domain-containing protein n=1 Tax=Sorangium sp. So ce119 TaxID=3133279 RepID=UPI003F645021